MNLDLATPNSVSEKRQQWRQQYIFKALSVILFSAGALQISSLFSDAGPHDFRPQSSAAFHAFSAALDLSFAAWLFWGKPPKLLNVAAKCLFLVFLTKVLADAYLGAADCGCFGQLKLNPWYTATLDSFLLVILFGLVPGERFRRVETAICRTLILASVLFAVKSFEVRRSQSTGVAFVNPSMWIGKKLTECVTISPSIPDSDSLKNVVFFRFDCDHCHSILPIAYPTAVSNGGSQEGVFLVEVPTFERKAWAEWNRGGSSQFTMRVKGQIFFPTPTIVTVQNGKVMGVVTE